MKFDTESILKRKKRVKAIKIILFIIFIVVIYNIILLGISSVGEDKSFNLFGYKAYIITSESMKPKIEIGDVIIVKKVGEEEINTDDIIAFKIDNELTNTHRIINIIDENGQKRYITKGDNNREEDIEEVSYDEIQGKVVMVIPALGNVVNFMQDKIIVLVVVLIILIIALFYIVKSEKKETRRRKRNREKKEEI